MIFKKHKEGDYQKKYDQSEETCETEWENIKKLVTSVASEVAGCEERKKRNGWYDEECQRKVEEREKA